MEPKLESRIESPLPPEEPESGINGREEEGERLSRIFIGPNGLRVGWSILIFFVLYYIFRIVLETVYFMAGLIGETIDNSATAVFIAETIPLLSLIGATKIMALMEDRSILSYNLSGPRRARHFVSGLLVGFSAISLLAGLLAWGGWLHFDSSALTVAPAVRYAMLWGCAFLAVAFVEEGLFRCYTLFTLARGVNFWWALAAVILICADAYVRTDGNGALGVYAIAAIGLLPCLILHQRSAPHSGFWQAAWVTSSLFALYHTQNNGENWVGIIAVGAVGFLFCLSVRLTGTAWWALGFHAAWDWTETLFYGTADSGLQSNGHLFSSRPVGNPLWSGGTDGPEGSLLVVGVILLLLLFLVVVYGRGRRALPSVA